MDALRIETLGMAVTVLTALSCGVLTLDAWQRQDGKTFATSLIWMILAVLQLAASFVANQVGSGLWFAEQAAWFAFCVVSCGMAARVIRSLWYDMRRRRAVEREIMALRQ